jgi:hypothetical protein
MRSWVAGLSAGAALVAMVGTGCSSSSSPAATGPADSSLDQSSAEDSGGGPACPIDASIATYNYPDAALNDAGGNATVCGACLNTNCASDVATCDQDCSCLQATKAVLACGADGGTAFACAVLETSDQNFVALARCIFNSCASECALAGLADAATLDALPDASPDAGSAATGDASSEAGADAGAAADGAEQ